MSSLSGGCFFLTLHPCQVSQGRLILNSPMSSSEQPTQDSPPPSTPDRAAQARIIAENPVAYKVCEGCDSIVSSSVTMCPNCHGYRFDASPNRVVGHALELGARRQQSVTADDLIS